MQHGLAVKRMQQGLAADWEGWTARSVRVDTREREGEAWQGKREKNGLVLVCILEFLKCVF